MKTTYLVIFLSLFSCNTLFKGEKLERVQILSISERRTVIVGLNCDDLGGRMGGIHETIITNEKILATLLNYVKQAHNIDEKAKVDIRTKVIFHFNNSRKRIVCFDQFNNAFLDDERTSINANFFELVRKLK